MAVRRTIAELRRQAGASKVLLAAAALLLPAAGLACLLATGRVMGALPYAMGAAMVLVGVLSAAASMASRKAGEDFELGRPFVLAVLGVFAIANEAESMGFLATAWGLLGLGKAGKELDEALAAIRARRPFFWALVFTVFELVLALLLILDPFHSVEHHIMVLGVQLVLYPLDVQQGRSGVELVVEA